MEEKSVTSDADYLKIYDQGTVILSATGGPDSDTAYPKYPVAPARTASITIPHPLGFAPMVRAEIDTSVYGVTIDPYLRIISTSTFVKIILCTDGANKVNVPVHYKIYDLTEDKTTTSDYALDQIFSKGSFSGTVAASVSSITYSSLNVDIPHTGGEMPMYNFEFSEDQVNWYPAGTAIVGPADPASGPPGVPSRYFITNVYAIPMSTYTRFVLRSNYATTKTLYVRYVLDQINAFSNLMHSTDFDAYKNPGEILSTSITVSGTLAAGSFARYTSPTFTIDGLDHAQIMFDNSRQHSGQFKDIAKELFGTGALIGVLDSTSGVYFFGSLETVINGNNIYFQIHLGNTTASLLSLQSTVVNIRFVPYKSTI